MARGSTVRSLNRQVSRATAARGDSPRPHLGPGGPGGGPPGRYNKEKPKNLRSSFRRLVAYLRQSAGIVAALLAMMGLATLANVLGPMFQQRAIDCISLTDGRLTVDMEGMVRALLMMALLFVFSAVLTLFRGQISAKLSQRTVKIIRKDLFDKISRLPIGYLDSHNYGDLMSRMTNDADNISDTVSSSLIMMLSSILTLVGVTAMMFWYSPIMALITITTVPLLIGVSNFVTKFARRHYLAQQKDLGAMNGHIEEMITGYRTVTAYGRESDMNQAFAEISESYRNHSISARVWGSLMPPLTGFIGNLQYVILAVAGAWMIMAGNYGITIGVIQAMLQYSRRFSHPVSMLANQYASLLNAIAGAERIFEVLDEPDEIDEGTKRLPGREEVPAAAVEELTAVAGQLSAGKKPAKLGESPADDFRGEIEFRDVVFSYKAGEPVLQGLNMHIAAGQSVAVAGATGSGKTTLVNLLTRFYEPDSGAIFVDGVDIREITKADLRGVIAIVLQDTVLFNDTIGNNIRYGRRDASDEEVRAAAAAAMADRFIEQLPEGYDTMLAEAGSNLSQGQRQLLTIARAVLADPKILILDEATSSVDTRTEVMVQKAMDNLMKGRTTIMIAHRLSTIRHADRIDVVGDGRVLESGTHDELLAAGGEYARLYQKQYAGFRT